MDKAEIERKEYLELKDQLTVLSRTDTADLGPQLDSLDRMPITSERVREARDKCSKAYGDLLRAHAKHDSVRESIEELSGIVDSQGDAELDEKQAAKVVGLMEKAEEDLESSMELIDGASEKVADCYEILEGLEQSGITRQR